MTTCSRRRAGGFSLIEVLVSIIVLSFGILGMVGLQAFAMQANRDAQLQSTAVTLARELADMMRGNKDIGIASSSGNPYLGNFTPPLKPVAAVSYCLNVGTVPCPDRGAVASAQMTEWLSRVDRELPGARVTVCLDSAPFDGGKPRWACDSAAGATMHIKIGWTRQTTERGAVGDAVVDRATRPAVVIPVTPGNSV